MAARGFKSIGITHSANVIHVFTDSIMKRIIYHKDDNGYINSTVVLKETPAILLRTRLYNERRLGFEQKQKSENYSV